MISFNVTTDGILKELGFSEMVGKKKQIKGKELGMDYREIFIHDKLPFRAERIFGSYVYDNRWVNRIVEHKSIHIYRRTLRRTPKEFLARQEILVLSLSPRNNNCILIKENITDILPFLEPIKKNLPENGEIEITHYDHSAESIDKALEFLSETLGLKILERNFHYSSGNQSTTCATFKS